MTSHPLFSEAIPDSEEFAADPAWMALAAIAGDESAPEPHRPVRLARKAKTHRTGPYARPPNKAESRLRVRKQENQKSRDKNAVQNEEPKQDVELEEIEESIDTQKASDTVETGELILRLFATSISKQRTSQT